MAEIILIVNIYLHVFLGVAEYFDLFYKFFTAKFNFGILSFVSIHYGNHKRF